MDSFSVVRTLLQFKWVSLTVLLLTISASLYVLVFAHQTYRSNMTFALITPKTPTAADLQAKPELARLNADNPYLRSPDSALLSQVLKTKLSTKEIRSQLQSDGLSGDYTISQPVRDPSQASWGPGMLMLVTASATSPEEATRSAEALGEKLTITLRDMQKISGADDVYLASALSVGGSPQAEKDDSDKLRGLLAVLIGGGVLLFGSVSLARQARLYRRRQLTRHAAQIEKESTKDAAEASASVLSAGR
ncbi:MAG: hypothetical protein JWQ56_3941 [Pseudarthrobacter sp.]|nr:hypothetical protein [Pseudarthrobacter sp.]